MSLRSSARRLDGGAAAESTAAVGAKEAFKASVAPVAVDGRAAASRRAPALGMAAPLVGQAGGRMGRGMGGAVFAAVPVVLLMGLARAAGLLLLVGGRRSLVAVGSGGIVMGAPCFLFMLRAVPDSFTAAPGVVVAVPACRWYLGRG